MTNCQNCMSGNECNDHVVKIKEQKENSERYKVKDLIITQTHDKLKDFVLQKLNNTCLNLNSGDLKPL